MPGEASCLPSFTGSTPKCVTQREAHHGPHPSSRALAQRFGGGDRSGLILYIGPNLFPKELTLFAKRVEKFIPKGAPENSGGCGKRELGADL